jgi:23S rRNA pseudouridine1911/1915/1917 synthase
LLSPRPEGEIANSTIVINHESRTPASEPFEVFVTPEEAGERLDRVLSARAFGYSRSILQQWIAEGRVLVDGQPAKNSARLKAGARVLVKPAPPPPSTAVAQDISLDVIYEDEHVLVVNKPAGLVVHPAPGHPDGTLVNALRYHALLPEDSDLLRPGIVHRLDKDTSGVMVVAKRAPAREHLIAQFKQHTIDREYLALVKGHFPERMKFDTPYGRHPVDRKRFTSQRGEKRAITEVRRLELLYASSLVVCTLGTGRTHQVRVHLSEYGYPILADPRYGRSTRDLRLCAAVERIGRQALHAAVLGFDHPATGKRVRFESPLPADMAGALRDLRD